MARRAQAVRVRIVNGVTPKARRQARREKLGDMLNTLGAIAFVVLCFVALVLFLGLDPTAPAQHP